MTNQMEEEEIPPEECAGGEAWLVSYADLMTLLFAAFVVLYGIKPEGRSMEILGVVSRIREAFVDVPDVIPEEEASGPIKEGVEAFKFFKGDRMNKPIIKKYQRATNVTNVINKDIVQTKKMLDILNLVPLDPKTGKPESKIIEETEEGFKLRLFASYFYEPGQVRLKRQARKKVIQIGRFLKELERPIAIEGHTDGKPSGKQDAWQVSALRAAYVANLLKTELDFPMERIKVAGYADTKPIADNGTPEGRRLNRRIEIKIEYGE